MAEVTIEGRDTYTIYDDQSIGKVDIADEVVAIIAGLAATEVEGVSTLSGHITNSDVPRLEPEKSGQGCQSRGSRTGSSRQH